MNDSNEIDLTSRLEAEIGPCIGSDLVAHLERGVVVVVSARLTLLQVALAVAQDEAAVVQGWLDEKLLQRPSQSQLDTWKATSDACFLSVIVQPYVLIQPQPR